MLSCVVLLLGPWWINFLIHTYRAEELSREEVLLWFQHRILDGLELQGPPHVPQGPNEERMTPIPRWVPGTSQRVWADHQSQLSQETPEIILFPRSDSSCGRSDSPEQNSFTYYFQPSADYQLLMSAHFWFYAGRGVTANSSATLFILTLDGQLLQGADALSKSSPDGWTTYILDQDLSAPVLGGPSLLRVHCFNCQCHNEEPDKIAFLHLHAQPGTARSPRSVPDPIPWSASAFNLLQRPSQEKIQHNDCGRAEIQISFQELGWNYWIIHPKVLTFYYCHGNCSASKQTSTILGITQCCAPVPGTMRSLHITTTSDGGYSFKHETLPNIIPEECTCI
ncbi:inhibin alpha chain [Phyllopteryx taeniolatus]|uniref:inhibin alpha chain n=1 Tax=Phyllopteryx taeniolatus TaxID=161469 RepID=UPI002AD2A27A|nr:inhibin alpha chain [Phyllopteryx taeniolatus]